MTDSNEYIVSSGGSMGDLIMVRLDNSGNVYEDPFEFTDYDPIDKGIVEFEITGFQKRFEMARPQKYMVADEKTGRMPDPMMQKTRLEFTIITGPQAGKRWLGLYSWTVGDTSTTGKLIRALLQSSIPRNWPMTNVIGLCGKGYVKHSLDDKGQVKKDRDGNPYADISVDTVEPIATDPLPAELQPAKPSEQRAAKREPAKPAAVPMEQDPRISWSALWAFAGRWGFNGIKDVEKALDKDLTPFGCSEVYDMILDLTKTKVA